MQQPECAVRAGGRAAAGQRGRGARISAIRAFFSAARSGVATIINDGQGALLDSDFLCQTSSRMTIQCYIWRDKTVQPHWDPALTAC